MNIENFLIKKNNNLDFIRIVCASMVIIGHSYVFNPINGQNDLIFRLTGFTYSGALAVKIFFFISGMLVTDSLLKQKSISSFVIHRAFRIIPGLTFLLIISTFIIGPLVSDLEFTKYFTNPTTYDYIFNNIIFTTRYYLPGVFTKNPNNCINASLWSLRFEMRYYIVLLFIFIFFKFIIKKNKIIYLYTAIIIFVFVDAFFRLYLLTPIKVYTEFTLVPMSFALGSLMAIYKKQISLNYIIFFIFAILTGLFWRSSGNEFFFMITVCLFVVLLSSNKYVKKIKISNDISFGVYLWGAFVQQLVAYFLGIVNMNLFMVYSLFFSYIMGLISFIIVEKRFMEYGKRLDAQIKNNSFIK